MEVHRRVRVIQVREIPVKASEPPWEKPKVWEERRKTCSIAVSCIIKRNISEQQETVVCLHIYSTAVTRHVYLLQLQLVRKEPPFVWRAQVNRQSLTSN